MENTASQLDAGITTYDVGGVELPRPFKIRRFGHFGYNVRDLETCLRFYRDILGFKISDPIDFRPMLGNSPAVASLGEHSGYFMRHNGDHHSFVLFDKRAMDARRPNNPYPEVFVNQITWQVNSLQEVVDSTTFMGEEGTPLLRSGRDTPGSNWHSYGFDPDGHIVEIYYGIEQVGWDGFSKPRPMYNRGFHTAPLLPQINEQQEVVDALDAGVDLMSGYVDRHVEGAVHNVGGILLPRPFVITGIGPLRLFVRDVERSSRFYERTLGLEVTERREIDGLAATFHRCGSDHHAIALYDIALRGRLGVRPDSTTFSFGIRLGTYSQLLAAVEWLSAAGFRRVDLPPDVSPGMRYSTFFADPEDHLVELYCEIDQVGFNGQARSPSLLPDRDTASWPRTIAPGATTFAGEPFLGPML